jgi:hypothetical protein
MSITDEPGMNRSLLPALLVVILTSHSVFGQAKLLPPPDAAPPVGGSKLDNTQDSVSTGRAATLGPPTSAPSSVATQPPEVPHNAPPHQMYGREPAHGTLTAGEPRPPSYPILPPILPEPLLPPQVCPPYGRFWADLDGLVWWVKGDKLPPLVSTSPAGTPQNQAGVLGAPGTSVLGMGREVNDDARGGFRLNVGYWLDPLQTVGIQAGGFWLGNNNSSAGFSSNGNTILARPFLNANTGMQDSQLIGFPGVSSGSVAIGSNTSFDGWDVALRVNACCCCNGRLDVFAGYRQLRLADGLDIVQDTTPVGGSQVSKFDHFDTANNFYAAELGAQGEWRYEGWVFEAMAKMDVGWNASHVNISGNSVVRVAGQPAVSYPGGLLALPSNLGVYQNGDATVVPELGFNVAYDFNEHLRMRAGYSFLFWDHVALPGPAIDTTLNPNQFAPSTTGGSPRPLPTHDETDLVVQGVNIGVEVRY